MSEIICLILQEICFERRFEVSSVYAGDRERSIKETVVSCAKSCIQCHELWQVLYYLCSHFFFIRFTADTNSALRTKWCNPVVGVLVWQQLSPRHSEAGTSQHVYDSLMHVLQDGRGYVTLPETVTAGLSLLNFSASSLSSSIGLSPLQTHTVYTILVFNFYGWQSVSSVNLFMQFAPQ